MARLKVEHVKCDRCKRTELQPVIEGGKQQADMEARLGDKLLVFSDLCDRCRKTLENVWKELEEWERELVQPFGPTVQANQAPPLSTAPDYSPPKPHSAAGSKR